ncbi:hypothetical protein KY285_033693 [Solanum tuberosum]|nr:hypothetical protein KY284_033534 [Solanum tuberosum]KAH0648445.1 hypothetical protein KY285_033693 [Solanum tuberosum]
MDSTKSTTRVMEVINHFSEATGLVANMDKASYYCARINAETEQKFLRLTGFSKGTLPIRYLGLLLSSKKWSKIDCQIIIAVLFSIYNYSGAVFTLPQSILKKVGGICRDYLWGSTTDKRKIALVSWDKVETQQHLFVECAWTREVQKALFRWSGIPFRCQTVQHTLQWLKSRNWKKFHKEVAAAILRAVIYHIWKPRN